MGEPQGLCSVTVNTGEKGVVVGFIRRYRVPVVGGVVVVAVVGFLLFRPDKLFVDDAVDESLEQAFAAPTANPASPQAPPDTAPTTAAPDPMDEGATRAPRATTMPPEPVAQATGSFYGIDHSAEGTATVYEQAGRFVLRFEDDTDIQNGPDLYVWVLADDDYDGGTPADFLDLGRIKGNVGGQNYELPDDFDPDVHRLVLIWCLRFRVPFAAAPLA